MPPQQPPGWRRNDSQTSSVILFIDNKFKINIIKNRKPGYYQHASLG